MQDLYQDILEQYWDIKIFEEFSAKLSKASALARTL